MKKIIFCTAIVMSLSLCFSCSNDSDEMPEENLTPVSMTVKGGLGIDATETPTTITKNGEEIPLNVYTLDYLYLVHVSEGSAESLRINLDENKNFEFNLNTTASGDLIIKHGTEAPLTVRQTDKLYFSSHNTCTVDAQESATKVTPMGNLTHEPFGLDIYKSDVSTISLEDGGFRMFGDLYTQDKVFKLKMYRLTGMFKAELFLYRIADDPTIPLGVTEADLTNIGLLPSAAWDVTPYLVNYPIQFSICTTDPGEYVKGTVGVYQLADDAMKLSTVTRDIRSGITSGRLFNLTTLNASEPMSEYLPHVFYGKLSEDDGVNATINYMIAGYKYGVAPRIAEVKLSGEILRNDVKTLVLCMNISSLLNGAQSTLKAAPLTKSGDELPELFYFWE